MIGDVVYGRTVIGVRTEERGDEVLCFGRNGGAGGKLVLVRLDFTVVSFLWIRMNRYMD